MSFHAVGMVFQAILYPSISLFRSNMLLLVNFAGLTHEVRTIGGKIQRVLCRVAARRKVFRFRKLFHGAILSQLSRGTGDGIDKSLPL